jgi:serine protease Do
MRLLTAVVFSAVITLRAAAQTPEPTSTPVSLRELSLSLERLTQRVRPAVVQVFTTGYAQLDSEAEGTTTALFAKQRGSGSGVIVSADGYIITNSHVIQGGRRIQVKVAPTPAELEGHSSILQPEGKTLIARVIGVDRETDLALLKVDRKNLTPLQFGDSDSVRQGQLVMAFGNPLGLESSVTLGVVSSVARQLKPDDTLIYIQTDAPINPGNSGGPLVDDNGRVVGITTLILSQSGGSEGVGFAVPSSIVKSVFEQLRKDGHVHRGQIGIRAQNITPALAAGLKLPRDSGVILADVEPDGPAEQAGLKIGDIVESVDGRRVENARQLDVRIYNQLVKEQVNIEVQRDGKKLSISVPVVERDDDPMRFADLVDPVKNLVTRLGILAVAVTEDLAKIIPGLRYEYGLVVAARSSEAAANGLKPGDVIYSVNQTPVVSVKALQASLDQIQAGEQAVLQIQRSDRLMFLIVDLD